MNVRSGKFEAFFNFSQIHNKNVATYLMPGMLPPRIASFRLAVRYCSYMMVSRRDVDVFQYFLAGNEMMLNDTPLTKDDPLTKAGPGERWP
jgi:hypothetical protein